MTCLTHSEVGAKWRFELWETKRLGGCILLVLENNTVLRAHSFRSELEGRKTFERAIEAAYNLTVQEKAFEQEKDAASGIWHAFTEFASIALRRRGKCSTCGKSKSDPIHDWKGSKREYEGRTADAKR